MDEAARPADRVTGESLDRLGPTAIVSYASLIIFAATALGVFVLVWNGIQITAVMAGILGAVLGTSGNAAQTTLGFWLGGNIGAKQAATALAKVAGTPGTGPGTVAAPAATLPVAPALKPDDGWDVPPGDRT